jgi:peroxiredoxin 2/4
MTTVQHDERMERPPRLDESAPYFEGRSTQGPVKLSDYTGRWLVFFAHPADFTPVCASEMVAFAQHSAEFAALQCSLLALSVDSVYAHLAWLQSIREKFGVSIDFPIMEDVSMEISRRYEMIQPQNVRNADVRALFVIDPQSKVRAMLYYPAAVGRSVKEVLRLLQALQTTDRLDVVTPEGWSPGDSTVEPPPQTVAATQARRDLNGDLSYGCVDWYYYKKPRRGDSALDPN